MRSAAKGEHRTGEYAAKRILDNSAVMPSLGARSRGTPLSPALAASRARADAGSTKPKRFRMVAEARLFHPATGVFKQQEQLLFA